jgi:hypothetical protein
VYQHVWAQLHSAPRDNARFATVVTLRFDLRTCLHCIGSGSSSRKAPLAREAECNQTNYRLRNSYSSTSPDSCRSLKGFPGGSGIGSEEFVDGLMHPGKLCNSAGYWLRLPVAASCHQLPPLEAQLHL